MLLDHSTGCSIGIDLEHLLSVQVLLFQFFDINEQSSFDELPTKNVDAVIDLSACLAEHETPVERFFAINTLGVYKLLEYCRKNNIKKFILSSSHKVYNDIEKRG